MRKNSHVESPAEITSIGFGRCVTNVVGRELVRSGRPHIFLMGVMPKREWRVVGGEM